MAQDPGSNPGPSVKSGLCLFLVLVLAPRTNSGSHKQMLPSINE